MYKKNIVRFGIVSYLITKPSLGWTAILSGAMAWASHEVFGTDIGPFVIGMFAALALVSFKGEYFANEFRKIGIMFLTLVTVGLAGFVGPWLSEALGLAHPIFKNEYSTYGISFLIGVGWSFIIIYVSKNFPTILSFFKKKG